MPASTVAKTRRRARRAQPAPQAGVQRYRFTPDQFEQLGRLGLFDHQRVELIGGEIVQMPPVGPEHSVGKTYTASAWQRRKQPKWHVRVDDPLRIGDSEPVPDVAIVPGKPSDYRAQPRGRNRPRDSGRTRRQNHSPARGAKRWVKGIL